MGWVLSVRAASLATIVVSVTTWTTSGIVPAMAQRTSGQEAGEARRPAELSRLLGVWRGTYVCAQGLTGLMLTVSGSRANVLEAEFAFYPVPENPRVPAGRFRMSGVFDNATQTLHLRPGQWLERPPGYLTVSLSASVDLEAGEMVGTVSGSGCGPVRLTRGWATPGRVNWRAWLPG